MNTVEILNQLKTENPKTFKLLNFIAENYKLESYLSYLYIDEVELMETPPSDDLFLCVSSQNVYFAEHIGWKLINKDIFLLFGLPILLKKEQLDLVKETCDKIKAKKYKDTGKNIIAQFRKH